MRRFSEKQLGAKAMKIIKDIRIYKSDMENIDGNSYPQCLGEKCLAVTIHRIVMKLRESHFSLGEFDHLYLNFTTCLPNGRIEPSKRGVDIYHPWYRYYDIGVEDNTYENIDQNVSVVLNGLKETLIHYFSKSNTTHSINTCIEAALQEGENMKVFFKEKKTAKNTARIHLRYLDNGMYLPLLSVYDLDEKEVFSKDLPQMIDLIALGEIQLSSKKVTIKPRKNSLTEKMRPITFEL